MTFREIQQQLDLFQDLIVNSHAIITDGHFVDISQLNTNANHFFDQINDNCSSLSNSETMLLSASVETLLSHFDKLQDALDNQHISLSTKTKVSPNTVIAAYQN